MKLIKIQGVLGFQQKTYINLKAKKTKRAKDDFEKKRRKKKIQIMSNSVIGKTLENILNKTMLHSLSM